MTEEDQLLVAKAALAGVRFYRTTRSGFWRSSEHVSSGSGGNYSIGRAAVVALTHLGLMTDEDRADYFRRTKHLDKVVDVDISALAGCQLQAEEPTP